MGEELLTTYTAPIDTMKNKVQIIMLFYNNQMNRPKKTSIINKINK